MKKSIYAKYKAHKSDSVLDMIMNKKLSIEDLVDISHCINNDPEQHYLKRRLHIVCSLLLYHISMIENIRKINDIVSNYL